MTILSTFGGASSVDTGDIGHSLRCRSAASAYLSRTFGTPTNDKIWTVSKFVKRGKLGAIQDIFSAWTAATSYSDIYFDAADSLVYQDYQGGALRCQKISTAKYRDPSSALHIVVSCNTTNTTAEDRIIIWVNGTRITSFSTNTNYALNVGPYINYSVAHGIGAMAAAPSYLDGYLSRICFVDGQALTPSSFGYLNTEINEWVTKTQAEVKAVVDAGGTNSFMLDFDDATSLTTLGYDKSSKGNNWTLNNFSLTAGTTYDHMLDVPGNLYPTMSPLDPSIAAAGITLSNGNLTVVTGGAGYNGGHATVPFPTTGKWYCEVETTSYAASNADIGLDFADTTTGNAYPGNPATSYAYRYDGNKGNNGSWVAYGTAMADGNIVGLIYDADNGKLYFSRQGTVQNSGDPVAGTGFAYSGLSGSPRLWLGDLSGALSATYQINFGQRPFTYTPPTGFKALCQANLPTPAILNPSSAVAHRFEAGSGIAAAIASDRSGWSDWMEWFKRTDTTESWKVRFSDDSGNMLAFDTNGTKAAWSAPSTGTYLGAAFKVGATYGVVTGTYAGDSTSNKNISHSLGKAPTCGIVKNESTGTWYVWHTKMTSAAYFTTLNSATPPAQSNTNTPWGTGNWSSTQFMVTNNATNNLNATGSTYRYILFADIDGLLALLGHTGNASTDGAFESSGHKAQLLIEKDLSATTGFYFWSDKIDTYNVTASYLLLNTNAGTAAATGVDFCSNGTKYRSATIANASNPHMGISYSRTAGKYSLAR